VFRHLGNHHDPTRRRPVSRALGSLRATGVQGADVRSHVFDDAFSQG
jgi:hypothetical protein